MSSPDRWFSGICDVPDFPSPGIVFKDITPLWSNPELFAASIEAMARLSGRTGSGRRDRGAGLHLRLGGRARARRGFIPARKPGKLPRLRRRVDYILEYGTDALEKFTKTRSRRESRCLLVDDVLATGGTARAAGDLIRTAGRARRHELLPGDLGAHGPGAALRREGAVCPLRLRRRRRPGERARAPGP